LHAWRPIIRKFKCQIIMSGKFNNRTLLIVFLALAGILILTRVFTSKRAERTLVTDLVEIDTGRISNIYIYPQAEQGAELAFSRIGSTWKVTRDDLTAAADPYSVGNALDELLNLKADRLVARSEDKWPDFHVNDSLGTRVVIKEGKKTTLDMIIGRFNYQPPPGGYRGYGQQYGTGITYVRNTDDKAVYAVEGFLAMSFNQGFNSWRDQALCRLTRDQVTRVVFEYPSDTGFVAQKLDVNWTINGILADSTSMAQYLNGLSRKSHSNFADGFSPVSAPDYQVTFEGANMDPILIRAYSQPGNEVILHSSINPDSYFRATKDGLFGDIFKSSSGLISGTGSI
jgi:hypothetical protein